MRKILLAAAALCCMTMSMMAEPVSPSVARKAAARFLQGKGAALKSEAMRAPRRAMGRATCDNVQTEASPYYVFNASASKGFVIVGSDEVFFEGNEQPAISMTCKAYTSPLRRKA